MRQTILRCWGTSFWPLIGTMLFASACSSTTDERQSITSTPQDYCQRACDKAHACNDATDASACRSSCQTALAAKPTLRADFLAYVASCIDSSSCAVTSASKCRNEAQAQLGPSEYGRTLCSAFVSAGNQCDASGKSYPETTCLAAAKSYDDHALEAVAACFDKSCSALHACLEQAIPEVTLPH